MVYTYYSIGEYIVEYEQQGEYKAQYGKAVLKHLSERLTIRYGDGWSYPNLRKIRQFYIVYSDLINSDYQIKNDKQCLLHHHKFTLSWSHYLVLMRIGDVNALRSQFNYRIALALRT